MSAKKLKHNDKSSFNTNMFFVLVILVFLKMLVLNFLTHYASDDYRYATSTSIFDALRGAYDYYMFWGGRSVVQFILRVLLMLPKFVFNILNALVYVCLTFLIYKFVCQSSEKSIPLYIFIICSIWLYIINFGQVILWATGAVAYMWGITIILCFLLPYSIYISKKEVFKREKMSAGGMFFLGVIAGWCCHTTSGGAIFLVSLFIIGCKLFKQRIKPWMISGLVGCVIGFIVLTLAPGNFVRAEFFASDVPLMYALLARFSHFSIIFRAHFSVLVIIFIISTVIQILIYKDWKRVYFSIAYFITSVAVVFALVLSPFAPARAVFGATIIMIIACGYSLSGIINKGKYYKVAVICLISVLVFQFSTTFVNGFYDIVSTWRVVNAQHRFIEQEIANGNRNVVVPHELIPSPRTMWNSRFGLPELSTDPEFWINRPFADRYGLESIVREH